MSESLYPLLFTPVLKDYVWGGRNLAVLLGRALPDGTVAESWEIAAHEDGTSTVLNGVYAGLPLTAVHEHLGLELIGTNNKWAQARGKFPLLIKLLDATDRLSVQVHPDDEFARVHEGNELGKTEMWVVLHARPGAEIILGVRPGTTRENLREAIAAGEIEAFLNRVPVQSGDFVCVPSGTLHAIMGGLLIAEIQQNSNTTYRLYDWGRKANGKARPLHVEKALAVIDFQQSDLGPGTPEPMASGPGVRRTRLCRNRYFTTERIELVAGAEFHGLCNGRSLEIWGVINGRIAVEEIALTAVQFSLLPAALGSFRIAATTDAVCLRTYVEEN